LRFPTSPWSAIEGITAYMVLPGEFASESAVVSALRRPTPGAGLHCADDAAFSSHEHLSIEVFLQSGSQIFTLCHY